MTQRWDGQPARRRRRGIEPPSLESRRLANITADDMRRRDRERQLDVARASAAVLRQYQNGVDVGEFLVSVLASAQDRLGVGFTLLDNRPGSWEAAITRQLMESGGVL